jgi:uncharacterized membrane protein YdjX (TVP38/TMEM64 family)
MGTGDAGGDEGASNARRDTWRKLAAAAFAIAALAVLGRYAGQYVPRFAAWVAQLGAWGPIVFVLGYTIATVAFVPGVVLTLAAGAIFGVARGTVFVLIGATVGACAAFLIARYVARDAVARRISGNARFAAVDRAIGREGLKVVLLLRLSPAFPFNLLNYALGVTEVRFRDYALACAGMLPGTLLYVYSGKVAGDVAAAAAGAVQPGGPAALALFGVGLAATVVATALITRAARRTLELQVGGGLSEQHSRCLR